MLQRFKNFEAKYLATSRQKLVFFVAINTLCFLYGAIERRFIKGTVLETGIDNVRQISVWLVALFVCWAICDRFLNGNWDRKSFGKIAIVVVGGIVMVPVFIVVFCTLIPLVVTGHL